MQTTEPPRQSDKDVIFEARDVSVSFDMEGDESRVLEDDVLV